MEHFIFLLFGLTRKVSSPPTSKNERDPEIDLLVHIPVLSSTGNCFPLGFRLFTADFPQASMPQWKGFYLNGRRCDLIVLILREERKRSRVRVNQQTIIR